MCVQVHTGMISKKVRLVRLVKQLDFKDVLLLLTRCRYAELRGYWNKDFMCCPVFHFRMGEFNYISLMFAETALASRC